MILWTIPFVFHAMNYSDYYAQHPIFVLSAINTFCQCFIGFADVCVFSWRERPWKHIPGSDGTFVGSFCFWSIWAGKEWMAAGQAGRRESRAPGHVRAPPQASDGNSDREKGKEGSQMGLLASLKRWSVSLITSSSSSPRPSQSSTAHSAMTARTIVANKRTRSSGGSAQKIREAERAHERLAMERADWETNRRSFHERRASAISVQYVAISSPERKEWWDTDLREIPSH